MQTKVEIVKNKLALNFKDAKVRSLGNMIRFNAEELDESQLISLGMLSITEACAVKVKRSGTGLVVILEL